MCLQLYSVNQGIPDNAAVFAQAPGSALTPVGGTQIPYGTTPPPYPAPPPAPTGTQALASGEGNNPMPVPSDGKPTNPQGGRLGAPTPPASQMTRTKPSTFTLLFMIQGSGMVDNFYCVISNCTLICLHMFPSLGEYDEHLKKALCVERLKTLKTWIVRHHHRSLNGNWRCLECGKIYRTHNKLHKHICALGSIQVLLPRLSLRTSQLPRLCPAALLQGYKKQNTQVRR